MERQGNLYLKKNIFVIAFVGTLVLATLVFGVIGYSEVLALGASKQSSLIRIMDILYSAIRLFSLTSTPETDSVQNWAVSAGRLSAICTVFSLISIAALYALSEWLRSTVITKLYRNHYIVIGLNEESLFLIKDLLQKNKKVVVVDDNFKNELLDEVKSLGTPIILGDVCDFNTLIKANILRAKYAIGFTCDDLKNLSVLKCIIDSPYTPNLRCHIGIDNVMSYKLFEPGSYYAIDNIKKLSPGLYLNVFNIPEMAAIELFGKMSLQSEDLIAEDAKPLSILIYGFGTLGSAILRELLLLSHFPNGKKIDITIYDPHGSDFFDIYHQVNKNINGKGLDLWDVSFISDAKDIPSLSKYSKVIACNEDDNTSLKYILKLFEMHSEELVGQSNTAFYYYCSKTFGIVQDGENRKIIPFGSLKTCSSHEHIILTSHENAARYSHEKYSIMEIGLENVIDGNLTEALHLHDESTQDSSKWLLWENLPLYKRRSNCIEKRHIPIKINALEGIHPNKDILDLTYEMTDKVTFIPYLLELKEELKTELNVPAINAWMTRILEESTLTKEQLKNRIHEIAEAEHARWNAFHVVNNWKYGPDRNEKNKTHDCLLTWEDLFKLKADKVKYDYINIYNITSSQFDFS